MTKLRKKQKRLSEIIEKQMSHSLLRNKEKISKTFEVLIEGKSKKSKIIYLEELQ